MSSWHGSEPSSDEGSYDVHGKKRSSRACDRCRKTKSKCERPDSVQCKSCRAAGTPCTFHGPSFKRGPPKGYSHAIEQRWQRVESLLGVIISCPDPQMQAIVSELRKDKVACEIINEVDAGPFGSSNRVDGVKEGDLFATNLRDKFMDSGRRYRQSRLSRERLSTAQDKGLSAVPTLEWQRNLLYNLSTSIMEPIPMHANSFRPNLAVDLSSKLEEHLDMPSYETPMRFSQSWDKMYTIETLPDNEERDVPAMTPEEIRALALNENGHVDKDFILWCGPPPRDALEGSFQGNTLGLHLLDNPDRMNVEDGVICM